MNFIRSCKGFAAS